MSSLTEEQLRRIEANRQLALQRKAMRLAEVENAKNAPPRKPPPSKAAVTTTTAAAAATSNGQAWPRSTFGGSFHLTKRPNEGSLQTQHAQKTMKVQQMFGGAFPKAAAGKKAAMKGSCVLTSKRQFTVDVGFHQQLVEVFRSMPNRLYDSQTKKWTFPLDVHDQLMHAIAPLRSEVTVAPLPKLILDVFRKAGPEENATEEEEEIDLSRLEPTLLSSLMEFQKEGVRFGIKHDGRVLIADDMGLGKTIQAIAIASYYKDEWPVLVVTPASVRYSWLESFLKWTPSVKSDEIVMINTGKDPISEAKVYIMSYDLISKRLQELQTKELKVIIIDESHSLKNSKTARTQACSTLLKMARRRILLSGTPALSRPIELFPQLNVINGHLFPSAHQFGLRYCDGKESQWGWDFTGASNMAELLIVMEAKFMIRRLKSEVIKELPPKRREVVILDPSAVKGTSRMKGLADELTKTGVKGMERRGTLLMYFAETGAAKIQAVSNYITELVDSDHKFLCFAHHQVVLDGICFALEKKKCRYIRIDGSTNAELRKTYCDKFQYNDGVKVAVLSISATCTGITLTAAQLVVFAELFWNPGILTQAEDRVHRIGQENAVLIKYLVAKKTADDVLWSMIKHKLEVLNEIGLSKDSFSDASTETSLDRQLTLDLFATLDDETAQLKPS